LRTTGADTVAGATRTLQVLAELFEHTSDAILVLDDSDAVVDVNPRAEILLGAKSSQLVGIGLAEMVPVGSPLLAFLGGPPREAPLLLEVELERRGGGYVPVEITARRLEGGGTLMLCRDTTLSRTAA